MEKIPGLSSTKTKRKVTLTIDDDIGHALFNACEESEDEENRILRKAARIIRSGLFAKEEVFNGDFSKDRQEKSVPPKLVKLLAWIMEGFEADEAISKSCEKALNIAQMIRFNSTKKKRKQKKSTKKTRHSKKNEPPLPVLIGMLIHDKTVKRNWLTTLQTWDSV